MYNVGFGDCFLLRFPHEDEDRTVLVDCGSHFKGKGPRPMSEVVEQVIGDVTVEGKARIDVVIATHRHQDHVSGFGDAAWKNVDVGEVWLPWTEHPTDPEARRIRETQSRKAKAIHKALKLAAAPSRLVELAENSLTNAAAMTMLKRGFSGNPRLRYLPAKSRSRRTFRPKLLPGVTVHAMGPSRDPDVIRDMNPPKGESYLRLTTGAGARRIASPFDESFRIAMRSAVARRLFEATDFDAADRKAIERIADEDPLALVVALDKAVNGTSLLLMFEMGDQFLLFPGDAQWGTWQSALEDDVWRELIEKTTFLKVGHHGSHNSTPKDLLADEILPEAFRAMICTRAKVFKSIPRVPLLKALLERSDKQVARSDETKKVKGFRRKEDLYTDARLEI